MGNLNKIPVPGNACKQTVEEQLSKILRKFMQVHRNITAQNGGWKNIMEISRLEKTRKEHVYNSIRMSLIIAYLYQR